MSNKKARSPKKQPKKLLLVGLALLVMVSIFILCCSYKHHHTSYKPYPFKEWGQGDIIDDQKLAFSAYSVTEDHKGIPEFWPATDGHKFVLVYVSFKNKTGEVYHLSPVNSIKMRDNENHEYEVSSAPSIKAGLGGPVNNGMTMVGQVGFLVPNTAKDLKLIFDPKIVNENIITIVLNKL